MDEQLYKLTTHHPQKKKKIKKIIIYPATVLSITERNIAHVCVCMQGGIESPPPAPLMSFISAAKAEYRPGCFFHHITSLADNQLYPITSCHNFSFRKSTGLSCHYPFRVCPALTLKGEGKINGISVWVCLQTEGKEGKWLGSDVPRHENIKWNISNLFPGNFIRNYFRLESAVLIKLPLLEKKKSYFNQIKWLWKPLLNTTACNLTESQAQFPKTSIKPLSGIRSARFGPL